MKWSEWADERLSGIAQRKLERQINDFTGSSVLARDADGRELISFASNDYFGLTSHPRVKAAAGAALAEHGAGTGSARLIAGSKPIHSELERHLAGWKGEESALLFASGYAANVGVLTTFGTQGATIYSDELNHASIVDGCRLAHANVVIYRHGDVSHLRELMAGAERAIVVSDLVFSMDGDIAPADELIEACSERGALLVLDEAHAALGPYPNLAAVEHIRVGTLSKMLGSAGGFAASSTSMVRLLVNAARSFVFTTAGAPADAAAARAALRVLESAEGSGLRAHLARLIARFTPDREVPILTVPMPDEEAALTAARELYEHGFLVPAIRPPTVPSARLRISLSAAHSVEQVDALMARLSAMGLDSWRA
jgi:8-amino-7-oxononanoate synthase